MRILIATYSRGLLGGVEKYLQSLIPALLRRGHSAGLLHEQPSNGAEEIDSLGGRVPAWCVAERGLDESLSEVARWKPDLVYAHGLEPALESALLQLYPGILYAHTYYGTCVSGRKCHAWPRLEPCDRRFGPACLGLYHVRRCGGLDPRTMWKLYQTQSERHRNLLNYQAVLVASRHMHRELARHGVGPDRLRLLPLFSTDGVPPGAAPEPREPAGRVLFLGRLMDVKGVDLLLEALSAAGKKLGRRLTLTIAGDGPDRGRLETAARELGVAAEFIGWINSQDKLRVMGQTDLVAVPSVWPEPFGLVGIEAGCFGVPAVGFAVGGIPDWLIPGQTGEIAPGNPPTSAGLADAIVRAFSDPAHYQALRRGAWEVSKQFSLERHMEQLVPILAEAVMSAQPVAAGI